MALTQQKLYFDSEVEEDLLPYHQPMDLLLVAQLFYLTALKVYIHPNSGDQKVLHCFEFLQNLPKHCLKVLLVMETTTHFLKLINFN